MRVRLLTAVAIAGLATVVAWPATQPTKAQAACTSAPTPRSVQQAAAAVPPRLDLFARGTDNALYHRYWVQGSPWTCWESLRGDLASGAGVASHGDNILHLGVLGADGTIKDKSFVNSGGLMGGWSNWTDLGTQQFASAPAAASWGTDHYEMFALGKDGQIWHNWFQFGGDGWHGWVPLAGGSFQGAPAAAAYAPGKLHVFARGTDNRIWQRYLVGPAQWSAWVPLGDQQFASSPAAVSWDSKHLEVFARGTDNLIWHNWYQFDKGAWSGWFSFDGGSFKDAPAAGSYGPQTLNLFALGTDDRIWQRYHLGGGKWSPWAPMGDEKFTSAPASASWTKWETR